MKELLKTEDLPPLVTITHVMVSPNPYHDTAVVQYFWKNRPFPWIWENTVGLEGGDMFVRSDNCAGQFKSGRHFRFISEHSSLPHSRGMKLLWSHSEPCHGKDLSDPECGRCKFVLEQEEMRHTDDHETEMKTSKEAYNFLVENCEWTDKNIFQKKGKGIYRRKFHFVDRKEAPSLNALAEITTIKGSDSWHMFYDTGEWRNILVRDLACFSCDECKQMRWGYCLKQTMFGPTLKKDVKLKTKARVSAPLTKSRIIKDAKDLALKVVHGDILGVECAAEQEPYVILKATGSVYVWDKEDKYTMDKGWRQAGEHNEIRKIQHRRYLLDIARAQAVPSPNIRRGPAHYHWLL